jgi:hypothetical protein
VTSGTPNPIASSSTFAGDLRLTFAAWRSEPRLPLLTIALAVASSAPYLFVHTTGKNHQPDHPAAFLALSVLVFPAALFWLGFRGTTRVWYARIWQQLSMEPHEVWSLSWMLFVRLLRLGLLVLAPAGIAAGILFGAFYGAGLSSLTSLGIATGVSTLFLDILLTFVVPALVFATDSATTAWTLGMAMLRQHWRHAAAYILAPPLALVATSRALVNAFHSGWVYVVIQILIAMLDLAFKGAITAYYLRHAPPPSPPPPPPPVPSSRVTFGGDGPPAGDPGRRH